MTTTSHCTCHIQQLTLERCVSSIVWLSKLPINSHNSNEGKNCTSAISNKYKTHSQTIDCRKLCKADLLGGLNLQDLQHVRSETLHLCTVTKSDTSLAAAAHNLPTSNSLHCTAILYCILSAIKTRHEGTHTSWYSYKNILFASYQLCNSKHHTRLFITSLKKYYSSAIL